MGNSHGDGKPCISRGYSIYTLFTPLDVSNSFFSPPLLYYGATEYSISKLNLDDESSPTKLGPENQHAEAEWSKLVQLSSSLNFLEKIQTALGAWFNSPTTNHVV